MPNVYIAAGAAEMLDEREVTGRLDDQLAEALARLVTDAGRSRKPVPRHAAACPAPRGHECRCPRMVASD